MRLFVAVELDYAVRERAAALAAGVRRVLETEGRRWLPAGATWVTPERMHLTLRFLGEIEPGHAARVRDVMARPFPEHPFDLELAGLGLFPPAGPPRVLWIGVSAGEAELAAIAGEVDLRLEAVDIPREARPFRGHLTLARFRVPAAAEARRVMTGQDTGPVGRSRIAEVVLFESRLSPRGPAYAAQARAPMGSG